MHIRLNTTILGGPGPLLVPLSPPLMTVARGLAWWPETRIRASSGRGGEVAGRRGRTQAAMAFSCAERDERELRTDAEKKTKEGGEGATLIWLAAGAAPAGRWRRTGGSGLRPELLLLPVDDGDGTRWEAAGSSSPWLATRGTGRSAWAVVVGWIGKEEASACCGWAAAQNEGGGRSDLVGWMGTLRWVAAGSGGILRKGVAAAG